MDGGATYGRVAKLTADDATDDCAARSVAIDGDTVRDPHGAARLRPPHDGGATYGQVAKLTAADAASGDGFGMSVAIDDGHRRGRGPERRRRRLRSGSAYVFALPSTDYAQLAKLDAGDAAAGDEFGGSVAIDGDTVVVGAYRRRRRRLRRARPTSSARPTAAPRTARWPS